MTNASGTQEHTPASNPLTRGKMSLSSKILLTLAVVLLIVTSGFAYPEWLARVVQFIVEYGHLYLWFAIIGGMLFFTAALETGDPKWSKWGLLCLHCLLTLSLFCGGLIVVGASQNSIDTSTINELYSNQFWLVLGYCGATIFHVIVKALYLRIRSKGEGARLPTKSAGSSPISGHSRPQARKKGRR
ncbi:hypothetical protein [Rhizobium leguminosarum]|uniref:hypothetical protein n=1 Tax=Rhizobium leguminosarum TaxID=384 RepID=UPI001AE924A2|nr:hypothetical protein [Rhizobium leguminosarum]MBP2449862.1 hypothetical protein [Rhizobium leguminosarum]